MDKIEILGIKGLGEIRQGDFIAALIDQCLVENHCTLNDGDIMVIAQKVISKAEGQFVDLKDVIPSNEAKAISQKMMNKSAEEVQLVLNESSKLVRVTPHVMITEHRLGLIMANAGIDRSNVPDGKSLLLPEDPDRSAREIRTYFKEHKQVDITVIIADSFGRPWRMGQTNVAIGVSGMKSIWDYTGQPDSFGRVMNATNIAQADEIAGAAELVMNKVDKVPVVIVKGVSYQREEGTYRELIRPEEQDLFR